MSVCKFSKRNHKNDKWKNFLKHASLVMFRTAKQRATLTFWSTVMSFWHSGGRGLRVMCFNTQLCRTARDCVLTNDSRLSQLVIQQKAMTFACSYAGMTTVFDACNCKWSDHACRVTKCMHSRVVSVRLEGCLVNVSSTTAVLFVSVCVVNVSVMCVAGSVTTRRHSSHCSTWDPSAR